jgi:hypothetical protein
VRSSTESSSGNVLPRRSDRPNYPKVWKADPTWNSVKPLLGASHNQDESFGPLIKRSFFSLSWAFLPSSLSHPISIHANPSVRRNILRPLSTRPSNRKHLLLPLRRDLSSPVRVRSPMHSQLTLFILFHVRAVDSIVKDLASFLREGNVSKSPTTKAGETTKTKRNVPPTPPPPKQQPVQASYTSPTPPPCSTTLSTLPCSLPTAC